MIQNQQYKTFLYYLIETKDKFLQQKTNQIFKINEQRVILVLSDEQNPDSIILYSSVDERYYITSIDSFATNTIIDRFVINLN